MFVETFKTVQSGKQKLSWIERNPNLDPRAMFHSPKELSLTCCFDFIYHKTNKLLEPLQPSENLVFSAYYPDNWGINGLKLTSKCHKIVEYTPKQFERSRGRVFFLSESRENPERVKRFTTRQAQGRRNGHCKV